MKRRLTPSYAIGSPCPSCTLPLQRRPAAFANFRCAGDIAWCEYERKAGEIKEPVKAKGVGR